MKNKSLTAVQWLLNEFQEAHKDFGGLDLEWLKRFEQAKAMEKEQIMAANTSGVNNGLYGYRNAEQYYNETYGEQDI